MWLQAISCVLIGAVVFVGKEVVVTVARNRRAYKFFEKRSSHLPILPDPGIFSGHINKCIWVRRSWQKLKEIHAQYGPTFGMFYCDRPYGSTIDPDFIKAMVLDRPNDHLTRFRSNSPIDEFETDSVLLGDNAQQWRRLRNSIAPAFTKTKIMTHNVQSEISSVIHKMIYHLETELDRAKSERSRDAIKLDVEHLFLRYTIALVFTCFYRQDQVVKFDSKVDPTTHIIEAGCKNCVSPMFKFCIMFPAFIPAVNWLIMRFHPIGIMRKRVMDYVRQQISTNLRAKQQLKNVGLASNEPVPTKGEHASFNADDFLLNDGTRFRRNMMDYVIDQFHEGKINKSELLNNSHILFLAAAKTSGDALSKLVYNLAAHPEEQEKLRSSVLADGPDSEYLHWSINESMRLFPPAPFGASRSLSYDLTTKEGFVVPGGTMMYTSANLVHRLPEYWGPDADEFRPDRWRNSGNFHPAQFLAFGLGKRTCLGKEFAMREMKMLMTELLSRYQFKCPPETISKTIMEFDTYFVFNNSDHPINIEICRL